MTIESMRVKRKHCRRLETDLLQPAEAGHDLVASYHRKSAGLTIYIVDSLVASVEHLIC